MKPLNESQEKYYCSMCSRILSNGAEIICSCGGCLCITCATKCLFCSQVVCRGCVTSHANCLTPSEKAKIRTVFCCVCNKRFQGKNVSRCCSCGKKTCLQCHENHDCISKSFAHEAKKMFAEKIMVEPMHLLKMDVVDICVICMNDATVMCSCGNETNRCITCIAECTLCGKVTCKLCVTSHMDCIGMNNTMTFKNKIVVITGRLKSIKRKHAESLVITSGGDVGSTVSRNTDFVVVGENPGSKLDRAQALGIRIITEEEFLNWAQLQPSVAQTTTTVKKKKRRILL